MGKQIMKDPGDRYKSGLNFKSLPDTTRGQLAWLQDERGWSNKTSMFVQAIGDLYRKEREMTIRNFRYVGQPMLTRGDYGVAISGGHTTADDPDGIYTHDPDFGDQFMCTVVNGLDCDDWVEI